METVVSKDNLQRVIEAMIHAHPYEEVAYDVYPLRSMAGSMEWVMSGCWINPLLLSFINLVKERLNIKM